MVVVRPSTALKFLFSFLNKEQTNNAYPLEIYGKICLTESQVRVRAVSDLLISKTILNTFGY